MPKGTKLMGSGKLGLILGEVEDFGTLLLRAGFQCINISYTRVCLPLKVQFTILQREDNIKSE